MTWEDILKIIAAGVGAIGSASIIIVALSTWLGKVWANRILETDRAKYSAQLENLKASNENFVNSLSLAHSTYLENNRAFTAKRIEAIQTLWEEVIRLRAEKPSSIIFLDILILQEYGQLRTQSKLQYIKDEVDFTSIVAKLVKNSVDLVRPFIDDKSYELFWCYRALIGRLCHYIKQIFDKGAPQKSWQEDKEVLLVLGTVLNKDELDKFRSEQWSTTVTFNYLEGMLSNHLKKLGTGMEVAENTLNDSIKFYKTVSKFKEMEAGFGTF